MLIYNPELCSTIKSILNKISFINSYHTLIFLPLQVYTDWQINTMHN